MWESRESPALVCTGLLFTLPVSTPAFLGSPLPALTCFQLLAHVNFCYSLSWTGVNPGPDVDLGAQNNYVLWTQRRRDG